MESTSDIEEGVREPTVASPTTDDSDSDIKDEKKKPTKEELARRAEKSRATKAKNAVLSLPGKKFCYKIFAAVTDPGRKDLRDLLKSDANPNTPRPEASANQNKAIILAIKEGNPEKTKLLLHYGAFTNTVVETSFGSVPVGAGILETAVRCATSAIERQETLNVILGAKLDPHDPVFGNIIEIATSCNCKETILSLIRSPWKFPVTTNAIQKMQPEIIMSLVHEDGIKISLDTRFEVALRRHNVMLFLDCLASAHTTDTLFSLLTDKENLPDLVLLASMSTLVVKGLVTVGFPFHVMIPGNIAFLDRVLREHKENLQFITDLIVVLKHPIISKPFELVQEAVFSNNIPLLSTYLGLADYRIPAICDVNSHRSPDAPPLLHIAIGEPMLDYSGGLSMSGPIPKINTRREATQARVVECLLAAGAKRNAVWQGNTAFDLTRYGSPAAKLLSGEIAPDAKSFAVRVPPESTPKAILEAWRHQVELDAFETRRSFDAQVIHYTKRASPTFFTDAGRQGNVDAKPIVIDPDDKDGDYVPDDILNIIFDDNN